MGVISPVLLLANDASIQALQKAKSGAKNFFNEQQVTAFYQSRLLSDRLGSAIPKAVMHPDVMACTKTCQCCCGEFIHHIADRSIVPEEWFMEMEKTIQAREDKNITLKLSLDEEESD